MRELFVEKVIDLAGEFLDNNQRIKLKEILTEICLNYQIERIEQTKKQEILKNNTDILFTWLENEDYIVKSPVRRIHKVKTTRKVKETLTDENLKKVFVELPQHKKLLMDYGIEKGKIEVTPTQSKIERKKSQKKYDPNNVNILFASWSNKEKNRL